MTRVPRKKSESGIYHVVARGAGRQLLFEDGDERRMFLDILKHYRNEMGFAVIAWCLMGNHVHLLLRDPNDVLSRAMQRILTTFALEHNKRTGHVGHVFQDRFNSTPILDDAQLLACVRYIHDNPAKAGICQAREYPWSSCHEYVGNPDIADTSMVLEMLGGAHSFESFSAAAALDYEPRIAKHRMSDEQAREVMRETLSESEMKALEAGTKASRDASLKKLKEAGLSARQIERLTGVGRNVVSRV